MTVLPGLSTQRSGVIDFRFQALLNIHSFQSSALKQVSLRPLYWQNLQLKENKGFEIRRIGELKFLKVVDANIHLEKLASVPRFFQVNHDKVVRPVLTCECVHGWFIAQNLTGQIKWFVSHQFLIPLAIAKHQLGDPMFPRFRLNWFSWPWWSISGGYSDNVWDQRLVLTVKPPPLKNRALILLSLKI